MPFVNKDNLTLIRNKINSIYVRKDSIQDSLPTVASATANYDRPVIIGGSDSGDTISNKLYYAATTGKGITANPSTGTIKATAFSGSGASLTSLNANNISSGTLAVNRGGTGASSAANACKNLQAATVGLGETILVDQDLNTFTTVGSYTCPSSAIAQTLANTPYTVTGFKLEVFNTTSANQIIQEIKCNSDSCRTYRRKGNCSSNVWTFGTWYQVIHTTNGVVPISQGGTNATSYDAAKLNLGIPLLLVAGNNSEAVQNGWYKVCSWTNTAWSSHNVHMTIGTHNYANFSVRPCNISLRLTANGANTANPTVYLNSGSAEILSKFYIVSNPDNTTDTVELWYHNPDRLSTASITMYSDNYRNSVQSFSRLTIGDLRVEYETYTSGKTAYCLADHVVLNLDTGLLDARYLPRAGGTMTGAGPICFPILHSSGNNGQASTHYISAGGGFSSASGKYGVKFVCCDQNDCQSGIGQDLSNRAGGYDLSIVGGASATGFCTISFVTHPVNSTSYTTLGYFTEAGNLHVSGQVDAASFCATSDKRLKKNIIPYTNSSNVLDLPVYKFDFINGPKDQIGCLAQDLQEMCPELVAEGDDGYLSIHESKIVYLLILELKNMKKQLNELNRKIK